MIKVVLVLYLCMELYRICAGFLCATAEAGRYFWKKLGNVFMIGPHRNPSHQSLSDWYPRSSSSLIYTSFPHFLCSNCHLSVQRNSPPKWFKYGSGYLSHPLKCWTIIWQCCWRAEVCSWIAKSLFSIRQLSKFPNKSFFIHSLCCCVLGCWMWGLVVQ